MLGELRVPVLLLEFGHHLRDRKDPSQLAVGLLPVQMSLVSELTEARVRPGSMEGHVENLGRR